MKTKRTKKTDYLLRTHIAEGGYWNDDAYKTERAARYWFKEHKALGLKPNLFKRTTILEELKGR